MPPLNQPRHRPRPLLALGFALLFLLAALAPASAYTPNTNKAGDTLEPNPRLEGNVTISNHKPDKCQADVLCYQDDSNNVKNLATSGFSINKAHVDEPVRFHPSRVDCQYYAEDTTDAASKARTSAWCGNVSTTSWLDATNWATADAEGNDTIERVVRNGAHTLHLKNPGTNPGVDDADTYKLDFEDLGTDISKMRLILGVEIISLNRAASADDVVIRTYDGNLTGYNQFVLSDDSTTTADGKGMYLSNSSSGILFWDPLLTTGTAVNGGITGDIGFINIQIAADSANGATEIYIYALDLKVKRYEFGTNAEGKPVYNMTYTGCDNKIKTTPEGYACLATFGPNFAYQNAKDLRISYAIDAADLPADRVTVIGSEHKSETYTWKGNYRFTYELPTMIDLAWTSERIWYTLPVPGAQHSLIKADGVLKTTTFEKSKTGDLVELLASPPTGKEFEVEFTVLFTEAQMLDLSEIGFLGLAASNPLSRIWVWLSGLSVIGLAFAWGNRRTRRMR